MSTVDCDRTSGTHPIMPDLPESPDALDPVNHSAPILQRPLWVCQCRTPTSAAKPTRPLSTAPLPCDDRDGGFSGSSREVLSIQKKGCIVNVDLCRTSVGAVRGLWSEGGGDKWLNIQICTHVHSIGADRIERSKPCHFHPQTSVHKRAF